MTSAPSGVPVAGRGSMDAPGNPGSDDPLDRLVSAVGPRLDEARALIEEATSRWRGDAIRMPESARQRLRDLLRELGLVTREEVEELELRLAQLEHRLRLVERDGGE